jgi:NAD(P)-dependent dehydrogenase (short-subunit alcohol dehydrogenase family)
VLGLTQVMAQELGAEDITVNAICPGAIATARQASRVARLSEAQVKFDYIKPAVSKISPARSCSWPNPPQASLPDRPSTWTAAC